MPDIPRLVDDVIAFLKCKWLDLWKEWCKLAYEIAGGHLNGLSEEEAGRRLLAERWPTSFGFNYNLSPLLADHHIRVCERLKDLKNTILERIVAALHSGEARLIDSLGNSVLPNRITRESFKFDSGDVVPNDGTRLSGMRLVLTQARMPVPQDVVQAKISQAEVPQAKPSPEESFLIAKLHVAIAEAGKIAAKEGESLNQATGMKKVQDWWRKNIEPDVQKLWRETVGTDVPDQALIKSLMMDSQHAEYRRPRGRPPKN
jgi:hypothetical protein